MFVFSLIAILLAALIIAYKEDVKLCETIWPICIVMILGLYVLAFFRCLSVVDYISAVICIVMLIWIIKNNLYKEILDKLLAPQSLAVIAVMIVIALRGKDVGVDLTGENLFYAADLKSLYELGGFAKAYGNVIPSYGDYPPAMQLFQWLFVHIGPDGFNEGLGIVGYSIMNLILLLPLMSQVKFIRKIAGEETPEDQEVGIRVTQNKKYRFEYESYHVKSKFKVHITGDETEPEERSSIVEWILLFVINMVVCASLALIPNIASGFGLYVAMPDVTLGIAYGMLILAIMDGRSTAFVYYLRIMLYGCLIILLRTWGILWLLSAAVLLVLKIKKERDFVEDIKYLIIVPAGWLIEVASWIVLCFVKHRHSELTSYMLRAFTGKTGMVTEFSRKVLDLLKALTVTPVLSQRFGFLRLSPFIVLILFVSMLRFLYGKGVIEERDRKTLGRFSVIMFFVTYGFIFFEYIHIWENPAVTLTAAVEKYGLPYMLGLIVVILGLWVKLCGVEEMEVALREDKVDRQVNNAASKAVYLVYGLLVVFILMTADYSFLIKGGFSIDDAERHAIFAGAEHFKSEVEAHVELKGRRVLYLMNDSIYAEATTEAKAGLSYDVAPVAVVYARISDDFSADALTNVIADSHAQFIYTDIQSENISELLSGMCQESWESGRIYQIRADGTLGYIDI